MCTPPPMFTLDPARYRAETGALLLDLHAALPPGLQVQLERLLDLVEEDAIERTVAVEGAIWARVLAHLPGLEFVLESLREHAEWRPNGCPCCADVPGLDAASSRHSPRGLVG